MRYLLSVALLFSTLASANAAVTLAVSQQSGASVQERASQLAKQLGKELGTAVNVVVLPDAAQVEEWLNRYATAELALVEASYVAGKPGQFVTIGPVDRDLTLIGRQGIGGDLPQRIAGVLGRGGKLPAMTTAKPAIAAPAARTAPQQATTPRAMEFGQSKSASEDRYFVGYVYREKLGIEPELERLDYWTEQLQSGALSKRQLFDMACRPDAKDCNFR
jgi:hypothetical protein